MAQPYSHFWVFVACVGNLTFVAKAANENRGKIVAALVLISLALFYFRW